MKMRKLLASVVAGALALTTMAVATSAADVVKSGVAKNPYQYKVTATYNITKTQATKISLGASSGLNTPDEWHGASDDWGKGIANFAISNVLLNGKSMNTTKDAEGNVLEYSSDAGLQNANGVFNGTDLTTFTVTYIYKGTSDNYLYDNFYADETFKSDAAAYWFADAEVNLGVKDSDTIKLVSSDFTVAAETDYNTSSTVASTAALKFTLADKAVIKNATTATVDLSFDKMGSIALAEVWTDLNTNAAAATNAVLANTTANSITLPISALYDADYDVFATSITIKGITSTLKGWTLTVLDTAVAGDATTDEDKTEEDATTDEDKTEEDATEDDAADVDDTEADDEDTEADDDDTAADDDTAEDEAEDSDTAEDGADDTEVGDDDTAADDDAAADAAEDGATDATDDAAADAAGDKATNPATGVALAIVPAVIAGAAFVASRKRK